MTRKSQRGIVGKAIPTPSKRYKIGPGIDFVGENLRSSEEIQRAVKSSPVNNLEQ